MAELINRNDSLNDGRKKLNEAIKDSNQAKEDAIKSLARSLTAEQIAQLAELKADDTQQQLDNIIIESGTSDAETIQARGDYPLLKDRLNSTDSQLAHETQQRQNDVNYLDNKKADESYVDNKIANLDGLKFKGAFATLNGLKNAYPDGTTGLFIVHADNHWYYYDFDNSQWVKGNELATVPWAEFMTTEDEDWVV